MKCTPFLKTGTIIILQEGIVKKGWVFPPRAAVRFRNQIILFFLLLWEKNRRIIKPGKGIPNSVFLQTERTKLALLI